MRKPIFCPRKWNPLFLCTFLLQVLYGHSKNCVKNDQCSCTFDDGSGVVDLSALGKKSGDPLIKDEPAKDYYKYSFNPCYPFSEWNCENAAGCQISELGGIAYNIGDAKKVAFSFDGTDVIGTYSSENGLRASIVKYKCDPSVDPPKYSISGETSPGSMKYGFTITSRAACPGGAGAAGSISAGSILLIVFFMVLFVYLVTGVIFNRVYRQKSGREVIPNVTFWTALPGLIKDGFGFIVARISRRESNYQQI